MDATPSSVVCFKNGFSFVTTAVDLPPDQDNLGLVQEYRLGPLPDFANHGTIGIKPSDEGSPLKIFSLARAPTKEQSKQLLMPSGSNFSFGSFMAVNVNTRVIVSLKEDQPGGSSITRLEGKIKWVQPDDDNNPRMAVIETGTDDDDLTDELIDCNKIVHVKRAAEKEGKGSLVVRYSLGGKCNLSYLTRGLTWAPTYTILIDRDLKKLKLDGQACLLCDLPAFKGEPVKELNLVAGQPNICYQSLNDPLVSGISADLFIKQQAEAERRRVDPHGYTMLRGGAKQEYGIMMDDMPVEDAEGIEKGEAVEDFFFYKLKNVPLNKGQPLSMAFLEDSGYVEYEDIYHLDLAKTSDDDDMQDDDQKSIVDVQHSISFTNPCTDQPLTNGPVAVYAKQSKGVAGNKFLVQGILKFANPGEKVTINITKALDVQAKFFIETGKERKTEVVSEGAKYGIFDTGKTYAEVVEQKAKLIVNNSKDTPIKCKIEYELKGHLGECKPKPTQTIERGRNNIFSYSLNPKTKLVWEIDVPAKGQSEVSFLFDVKDWQRGPPPHMRGKRH